jgi:diphthamide biosynthesis methyltransferase
MKVWAYLNNNVLCCALNKASVPQGVNAIELDVNSPDDVIYDGTQIRVKTQAELLAEAQQKAIKDLSQKTTAYILKHYPEAKQRADVSNLTNGETYLAAQGVDITALRKSIGTALLNGTAFSSALSTLNTTYNTNSNATISYWLGQVLKVSYRQYFVYQVKQEYYTYLQEIQQATSLPLPTFEFKTPFPTLG